MKSFVPILALLVCSLDFAISAADAGRPRLQILNGSRESIDVFWLKSEQEHIPHGSIAAGADTIIQTTLGHSFEIVGSDSKVTARVTSELPVQAFRFDPEGHAGVPRFYTQSITAHGFPIVASDKVNSYALKEAAYLVDQMLAHRPEVRAAMIKSGARMCVMAHDEYTTDLPEFSRLAAREVEGFEDVPPKDYWDGRARGLGGSETDPYCSVAEENLLGFRGDPYEKECILVHEFAHNIHLRGMINVDSSFDSRLKATYDAAIKAGLWKGKYASVNHHEYFAEGVQSWFDNNRANDSEHNHVNTRALLQEYDPALAAMCREVFGDTAIKYTKPAARLTGHMAGYDPSLAPSFVWPERLRKGRGRVAAHAAARDSAANAHADWATRTVQGWTVHFNRKLLADEGDLTQRALDLLQSQLEEIVAVVPKAALAELQKVPLFFSPEYPGKRPGAEYHPDAGWLRDHGFDPAMAQGVEFTNVRIFEAERRRMPNFVLHELAHAYHDRVLPRGHQNEEIKAAYESAKAGGKYDRVERQDSEGVKRLDRAYAMTNAQEYFAECTEAFFSRNDFYPYTREELKEQDPGMAVLLEKLWGAEPLPPLR